MQRRLRKPKEQAHIVLAFPGISMFDPRGDALEVLTTVLGGQSGRLFDALREKQGLVYHVSASSTEGVDGGYVSVQAATSHAKVRLAQQTMWAELERMREQPVSREELARAKAWLLGQHYVSIQRRSRVASELAFETAYGLPGCALLDYPKRISAITATDVIEVARQLLDASRAVEVIVSK